MKVAQRTPRKSTPKSYRLSVVIEAEEGGFVAKCPELPGCVTEAETYPEALENIEDAIRLYIADMIACGEKPPGDRHVTLTFVEVAV